MSERERFIEGVGRVIGCVRAIVKLEVSEEKNYVTY